ncbi:MAG: phage tail tip lysozyme [Nanoarchaeota archaeon]
MGKRKKLMVATFILGILLVSSVLAISLGTIGATSGSSGCENKRIGLVGASNTWDTNPDGSALGPSWRNVNIIQEMCPGSTVFLNAKGGTWPGTQVSLLQAVLLNDNLDYVIIDPSANGQQDSSGITPQQYKDAVINLAKIVKDKNKNIKVIMLTNTPTKGNPSDYGSPTTIQRIKDFNADLLNNKLGVPNLIDFAVATYSAIENPTGSDACGKYCASNGGGLGDGIHFGPSGRRVVIKTIVDTVFKKISTPVLSSTSTGPVGSNVQSSGVSCLNLQRCNEIDEVWRLSLGIFIRGVTEIWDPLVLPPKWREFQQTQPGVTVTPGIPSVGLATGPCSQGMSNIEGKYCIDKWEATIYNKNNPSQQASVYYPAKTSQANSLYNLWSNGWKGTLPPNSAYQQMPERGPEAQQGFEPLAVSQPNVIPNMYVTKEIAEQACLNAGKRLCTESEWVQACKGSSSTQYPYGETYVDGKCNTNQAGKYPPGVVGWTNVIPTNQFDPGDPRNGKAAVDISGVRQTGSFSGCTNSYGVYDMVGNLAEAVSTPSSSGNALFKGSAFMRSGNNLNCNDNIGAHAPTYTDYSFGFRCCSDVGQQASIPSSAPIVGASYNSAAKKLYNDLLTKTNNLNLVKAVVANSVAESQVNPTAAGDCGSYGEKNNGLEILGKGKCCSFGLWQYNICGGMGTGFLQAYGNPSTSEGKFAVLNDYQKQIDYMFTVLQQQYSSKINEQMSVDEWVAWFVVNIERPANQATQIKTRQKIASDLQAQGVFNTGSASQSSVQTSTQTSSSDIKQQLKNVAEAEYIKWGKGTKKESDSDMIPVVQNYFSVAGCAGLSPTIDPWSAAFVSYVAKEAGVTDFPVSCLHTAYFRSIKDNPGTCKAYPMSEKSKVQAGDIVCACRVTGSETDCSIDFNDVKGFSHCDIVVNNLGGGKVEVIGGNVNNNVEKRERDLNVDDVGRRWYGFLSCG